MSGRAAVVAAAVSALVVHLAALRGGFVYDDHRFIERNPAIESLDEPGRFFTDLSTTASEDAATTDVYRPLRTLSYAALRAAFGPGPRPIHALSIALHAATAGLLCAFLLRTGARPAPALLAALAFALHPVTVEATAWASALGDLWCGFFGALSLLLVASGRGLLALLCLPPALLGKEHAVVLPALWFLVETTVGGRGAKKAALCPLLPGIALVAGYMLFRRSLGAGVGQLPDPLGGSHASAALTMLSALGFYAACVLFPSGPTFDARVVDQHSVTAPVLLGALVLAAVLLGAVRGGPRTRLGALLFLVALAPVSNLLAPLKIPTADRFLYLPLFGGAVALAHALEAPVAARWAPRVAFAPLLLLALLTNRRIGDWRDDASLNAARRAVHPKSMTGLWADAADAARRAIAAYERERFGEGDLLLSVALRDYDRYLRNAAPEERVQVHIETADLLFLGAVAKQKRDQAPEFEMLYRDSLVHYRAAHALQTRGVGRVVAPDVEHAADRILELCVRLANPGAPALEELVREGWAAGRFLSANFPERRAAGADDFRGAQLLLVQGIVTRGRTPEKAREYLDAALRRFEELEAEGRYRASFQRAQCVFYRAILKDRETPDRGAIRAAHDLFLRAAEESAENRSRAIFLAGRARCAEARLFVDPKAAEEGLRLLAEAEKLAESRALRSEIEGERDLCSAR